VRDERGYIITGSDLLREAVPPEVWPLERPPMLMESSVPGVFAVGDVRCGSVKRVASAVGEGSIVVQLVHKYLN
jgi:thioredoxin reductase (NADPH)